MKLSIVTTMYHSAPYLERFYDRISKVAEAITDRFEIVFVDDGSPDDSLAVALRLFEKDKRVKIVELSRNFGHDKSRLAGIAHAQGDLVFLIDCDLEEEPELLSSFHDEYHRSGADVVYGVQAKRKGGVLERISGDLFYRLFNLLSDVPIPHNIVTARLMSRPYAQALIRHKDKEIFLAALFTITGFRQSAMTVQKLSKGSTTYTHIHKTRELVNAITSFSVKPLVYIFYLGALISVAAFCAAVYLVWMRISHGFLPGWLSLIVSIWLFGGLILLSLGVIGIYLAKVFRESKDRPFVIEKKIYSH